MPRAILDRLEGVAAACRAHRVRRLELFGSAARGEDRPDGDVDFLVEFDALPPPEHARCYFGLLFALEDLFQRPVDLVESSAVSNPFFLRAIARDRRVVYAA